MAAAHPDRRIELWFEDECRVGLKGRTGHRWWVFLLLSQVQLAKRLDVKGAAERTGARVPRLFVTLWQAESGRTSA